MSPATDDWHDILAEARFLSPRYRQRYRIVLAQAQQNASSNDVDHAKAVAVHNPLRALSVLSGIDGAPLHDHRRSTPKWLRRLNGAQGMTAAVQGLLGDGTCVECVLADQPVLEQTRVPIHPSRRARLAAGGSLVALVWPAASLQSRANCLHLVNEVAARANSTAADEEPLQFACLDEHGFVWAFGQDDPWVFAPNLGRTVEDELRDGTVSPIDRRRVVAGLARLRRAMFDVGVVWQGFAPRNMFRRGGSLLLIDFEDAVRLDEEPVRAAEMLLWHRVFFADCLADSERDVVFDRLANEPVPRDDCRLVADGFERTLLGVDTVTWRRRRDLLAETISLEGRHRRPSTERDGGVLYGHELGHFWGDFVPVECEVRIFRGLRAEGDPTVVAACMEAFEAAMEADICRSLRLTAAGRNNTEAPRTVALAEAVEIRGAGRVAAERSRIKNWYQQLGQDPAGLLDTLIFRLGASPEVDTEQVAEYLIGAPSQRDEHTAALTRTVRAGLSFLHGDDRGGQFLRQRPAAELRDLVQEALPQHGAGFDEVLTQVSERIAAYSISQAHPGYLAFPDSGNALAAVAANVLAPMLNQNLIAFDRSAPAATFVEIQVVEWLRELVGYRSAPLGELRGVRDVAGLWTTGGHLSNHVAMLTALGQAFPQARREGLRSLDTRPLVVMAGPIAHYSHSDAAFHLGLGWDAIHTVAARPGYTTDPDAVAAVLADPPDGATPFMVVGVAGNCRTTGLDDLAALADVCQEHGVWLHADACHGGSLIFNQRLRQHCLAGIERANSVSLDPHKGLFTPYPSSYVVFRDRGVLNQFSRHDKAVLADGCWDLGLITPFLGSRGFESLATWMLLKHVGVHALGELVDARQALVRHLERRIDETGLFVRLNDVDFYRLAFVLCPPRVGAAIDRLGPEQRAGAVEVVSRYTSALNDALYRDGRVCFDEHTLADLGNRVGCGTATYTVMACCPGNPLITQDDLDRAVDRLVEFARPLAREMNEAIVGSHTGTARRPTSGPAGWSDP